MKKNIIRWFSSSVMALAFLVPAAANAETFTITTPRYVKDGITYTSNPNFVSGTRGTFEVLEGFTTLTQFACNNKTPSGYYANKWVLSKPWGVYAKPQTTITTWEDTNIVTVEFDSEWADKYGTALELTVYIEQMGYSVSYDTNGGNWVGSEPSGGEYTWSEGGSAPLAKLIAKEYCALAEWNTKPDGTGVSVKPGESFTGETLKVSKNDEAVTLYAIWGEMAQSDWSYYVSYDDNGGSWSGSEPAGGEYLYPEGDTAPLGGVVERSGYDFVEWNTKVDGSGVSVAAGEEFTGETLNVGKNNETVTLYAIWSQSSCTITAVASPTEGGKVTGGGTYKSGKKVTLKATANSGFTFVQWSDGVTTASRKITVTESETYEAEFVANKISYSVAYDTNGGSWTGSAPAGGEYSYDEGDKAPKSTVVERSGYNFVEWNTKVDGSGVSLKPSAAFTGKTLQVSKNNAKVTLYAIWEAEIEKVEVYYTVSYDANGGSWTGSAPVGGTYLYAEGDTTPAASVVSKNNYTFLEWNTKVDGSGVSVAAGDDFTGETFNVSKNNEKVTLYAIWDQAVYTITAVANPTAGGKVTGGGTYDAGETVTLKAVANSGYTFVQWSDGSTSETRKITVSDDAIYEAEFKTEEQVTSTVTFNANGGSVSQKTKKVVYDAPYGILPKPMAPTGKVFAGWYTATSGGIAVTKDTIVKETSSHTLYAQWAEVSTTVSDTIYSIETNKLDFTIGVKDNIGGSVSVISNGKTSKSANLTATADDGFKFLQWNDGDTTNPRTVTIGGKYIAEFTATSDLSKAIGLTNASLVDKNGTASWKVNADAGNITNIASTLTATKGQNAKMAMTIYGSGKLSLVVTNETNITSGKKLEEYVKIGENKYPFEKVTNGVDIVCIGKTDLYFCCECTNNVNNGYQTTKIYNITWTPTDATKYTETTITEFTTNYLHDVKRITSDMVTPIDDQYYTGKKIEPAVDIPGLVEGEDYTIEYVDNTDVGIAKVLIYACGDVYWTGTSITFDILSKDDESSGDDDEEEEGEDEEGEDEEMWEDSGVEIDFGESEYDCDTKTAKLTIGENVNWTLTLDESVTKVLISGLPSGLKYTAKTLTIAGAPTRSSTNPFTVKVKVYVGKTVTTYEFYVQVDALPTYMVGTYYGAAMNMVDGNMGNFQLTVAKTGKVSGFVYVCGKRVALKSTLLEKVDDQYVVTMSGKYLTTTYVERIVLERTGTIDEVELWTAKLADDSEAELLSELEAWRDVFKPVCKKLSKAETYSIDDLDEEANEYLTIKLSTSGTVSVAGKLLNDNGKLTAVTYSTKLAVLDEEKSLGCWIAIYKTISKCEPLVWSERWERPQEE